MKVLSDAIGLTLEQHRYHVYGNRDSPPLHHIAKEGRSR